MVLRWMANRSAMLESGQTLGNLHPPALWKQNLPRGGGFGLAWLMAGLALAASASAQTLRLGTLDLAVVGTASLSYDSNVDGLAELEEKPGYQRSDVYWMAGLAVNSQPVAMRPSTTLGLSASVAYQDYFVRNDLDSETYNLAVNFQTTHPRLTLGGMARAVYSVDSSEHEYVPGGATRDPLLTHQGTLFANWNYRILRLEAKTGFTRERHDYEEFWAGDKDESTFVASAFLDLFSWGSLYYTWERTITTLLLADQETDEVTETFGITGAVPLELLRRPKITYSLGVSREQKTTDDQTDDTDWEFVHTVTVQDEFQISKTVRLSATASWVNDVGPDEEEVTFQYSINLVQQLGPRAEHSLNFTQEPRPTFGSTTDTETTTYGYRLAIRDLVFQNLSFALGLTYQEDKPLEVEDAVTEETTTLTLGLNHTRQLTQKLDRILSYQYSWEDSNLQDSGVIITHLVTYGLSYRF